MTTCEAIEAFGPHFAKLKPNSVPVVAHMLANNERSVEALKAIALRGLNAKKKFRIVVDYDPEFPLIAVDVFDLN